LIVLKTSWLQMQVDGMSRAFCRVKDRCGMLKITVVEQSGRRRVIVEGRLIAPWAAELMSACHTAAADIENRKLIVDLRNVTAISPEGEDVLLQLMRENVKLVCGVYTREILKQLVRRPRSSPPNPADE
jgi:hypothetical protein